MTTFGPKDADAWYERNKHKLGAGVDPVMKAIEDAAFPVPKRVLEIGCADGWRLGRLNAKYDCRVFGLEMSELAISHSSRRMNILRSSERNRLFYKCDLVIHGFGLYLYAPDELFHEVCWVDGLLSDGGHLVIHDFLSEHPYSRTYEHNKELRSRKMDHAQLWLAHPAYSMVRRDIYGDGDDRTHVTILKRDMANAFPLREPLGSLEKLEK